MEQEFRARITDRLANVTVEVFFIVWDNLEQIPINQRQTNSEEKKDLSF